MEVTLYPLTSAARMYPDYNVDDEGGCLSGHKPPVYEKQAYATDFYLCGVIDLSFNNGYFSSKWVYSRAEQFEAVSDLLRTSGAGPEEIYPLLVQQGMVCVEKSEQTEYGCDYD